MVIGLLGLVCFGPRDRGLFDEIEVSSSKFGKMLNCDEGE